MGESFLGLPNRFKVINNLLETTYNPTHALSAYQGYVIMENFDNYLKTSGGDILGDLGVKNILPLSTQRFSLGTPSSVFSEVYSERFFGDLDGNATSSSKWNSAMKLTVTGSVTGEVSFDGETEATLDVTTNHNHDQSYLKLTGGTLTGPLKLSKGTGCITSYKDQILFDYTSDGNDILQIGHGPYYSGKGATSVYSSGDVILRTKSSGLTLTSDLYGKTVNVGASDDSVYLANTEGNDFLSIHDDHSLKFNGELVYHHGNFKPENLLYTDYKEHVDEVKKVIKVLTILVDQLEVSTGVKTERDYPEASITDALEYYKKNAIKILDK